MKSSRSLWLPGLAMVMGCASSVNVIPRDAMTHTRMTVTRVRIGMYAEQADGLPQSLDSLPIREGYDNEITDGWGRPLIYSVEGDDLFTLKSLGEDGAPGGTGENADVQQTFQLVDGKPKEIIR